MVKYIYFALLAITLAFSSCNGDGDHGTVEIDTDTLTIDTSLGIDTTAITPIDTVAVDSAGYLDEEEALTTKIEKTYGVQWDFCDCVVKNDSVNTAILETDDDNEIDIIFARMEVIDQHCKELLTTPNTTPEERAKHERKVRKCLKAAK